MDLKGFLYNLSLEDIILIGSAAMFFSTIGAYAGLIRSRSILWCVLLSLALLSFFYREVIFGEWLADGGEI